MSVNPILKRWRQLGGSRPGRWLCSRMIGFAAPYSSSIRASVQELEPGRAVLTLRDRRRVRNHLRSIHAAAMMNLCELTGGLLAAASMPADARMIIVHFQIDFLKKARGTLRAQGTCEVPSRADHGELPVEVSVRDRDGDEVARATVTTLVGAIPGPETAS